ncbi:MAG: UDP-glucose 4-epimerase GalE [Candidatus Aminicenantes bacterium]|nr:UDP-glucose 4-epimerase GalE [Candidatus Aminicenantes bacterium]
MKILVTGGAGYIGSVTVWELIEKGHSVFVFDNLSQGHRQAVHPGAELVVGDLADKQSIESFFKKHEGIEAVMHFASRALVGESMRYPDLYVRDNIVQAVNVLDAAVRFNVERFVLSSTANLFGRSSSKPIDEDAVIEPASPYGESKAMIERILKWYEKIFGIIFCSLRYFNAAGATKTLGEDHRPETHIIPLLLRAAAGKKSMFTIYGDDYPTPDGTCVRDYIHVQDLAAAHVLALDALDKGTCFYNLGNKRGFSVKEVIDTACRVTGRSIDTSVGPRRAGDPPVLIASSERFRKEFEWKPRFTDLESIISTAWEWHNRFPNGYQDD